jgi:hypothetical protein
MIVAPPSQPLYATVKVKRQTMGQAVPALNDVVNLLGGLMTDPSPGGLLDLKTRADNILEQVQSQIDTLAAEKGNLENQLSSLTLMLQTLTGALSASGVASVEFSGDYAEVINQLGTKGNEIAPVNGKVYGLMLVASTGEADRALSAIIGIGRTLKLP